MLVLSRKTRESLIMRSEKLSEPIRVVIVSISGSRVKLGIIAGQDVAIARDELAPLSPSGTEMQIIEVPLSALADAVTGDAADAVS